MTTCTGYPFIVRLSTVPTGTLIYVLALHSTAVHDRQTTQITVRSLTLSHSLRFHALSVLHSHSRYHTDDRPHRHTQVTTHNVTETQSITDIRNRTTTIIYLRYTHATSTETDRDDQRRKGARAQFAWSQAYGSTTRERKRKRERQRRPRERERERREREERDCGAVPCGNGAPWRATASDRGDHFVSVRLRRRLLWPV